MSPEAETPDPADILPLLVDAVGDAGAEAMRFFGRSPDVWEKDGHGPVSEADYAANAVLAERLRGACPEYGWLSEESPDDAGRLERSAVWIVDPIDGTRGFLDGKPEFTICAGLAVAGEPVAGAVYNPAKEQLYSAARGRGAALNGTPIRVSEAEWPAFRAFGTRKTWKPEHWRGAVPDVKRGYVNSIAYRLCLVAEGRWDACVALNRFSEWDLAAAHVIVAEAGGRITGRGGERLRYNQRTTRLPGLIAAGPVLHERLRSEILPPPD